MDCHFDGFGFHSWVLILEQLKDVGQDELKADVKTRLKWYLIEHLKAAASALREIAGGQEASEPVYHHDDSISILLFYLAFILQGLYVCLIVPLRHKDKVLVAWHQVRAVLLNGVFLYPLSDERVDGLIKTFGHLSASLVEAEEPYLVNVFPDETNFQVTE